jgi:hypothetical protein
MPFVKGKSGNPGGRPKGRQNTATLEIKVLTRNLFDHAYWQRIRAQLRDGSLHPSIEARLLAYAYGEPRAHDAAGPRIAISVGFLEAPDRPGEVVEAIGAGTTFQAPLALRSVASQDS